MWDLFSGNMKLHDQRLLARAISLVENQCAGYEAFLAGLPPNNACQVIGITGPPGAGKSTITDAMIGHYVAEGQKVGVLCVDPSSPFNLGAVLGDRIRMSEWYNHPGVFIRSLASRGSVGGLHPMILEITDLMKSAGFNKVLIETVGVGQSEIEIAGLADITVVVLVPEAGDEIQAMKAGLMEIADLFVVNKSDRPGADNFAANLVQMMAHSSRYHDNPVPVLKTIASTNQGIGDLCAAVNKQAVLQGTERKIWLLAEKAYYLLARKRMKDISKQQLADQIGAEGAHINIYKLIEKL